MKPGQYSLRRLLLIVTCLAIAICLGIDGYRYFVNRCDPNAPRPLAKTATLEVFLVSPIGTPTSLTDADPHTAATIYFATPPITVTADVLTVRRLERRPNTPELVVNFKPAGAKSLAAATTPPQGMMAIRVNGKVISVARVMSTISSNLSISGFENFDTIFDSLTRD